MECLDLQTFKSIASTGNSTFKEPPSFDEIDQAILQLLTPAKKEDLINELSWFIHDFRLQDVENYFALISHCIIDADNSLMEKKTRAGSVFFIGRIINLLRHLMPPNPGKKPANNPSYKK